jgi:hypothetical protein
MNAPDYRTFGATVAGALDAYLLEGETEQARDVLVDSLPKIADECGIELADVRGEDAG